MPGRWIATEKRLAIYNRDNYKCAYCGKTYPTRRYLTLDHVKPRAKGGSNHQSNLVTCCQKCNNLKSTRTLPQFVRFLTNMRMTHTPDTIYARVRRYTSRKLVWG